MIKKTHALDMTTGNPLIPLLTFALPIFLGNAFQQFYNMADSMIVGRFINADALAAVGTCTSPANFFINLNMGTSSGLGILIAQSYGAKKEELIRPLIINALCVMTVTSVVIGCSGFLLAPQILHLMGVPEGIFGDALVYLRMVFLNLLWIAVYNVVAGSLRAMGDSRTPLYFLIFSCVINIFADIICVTVLQLGVLGVALATLISQIIVAVVTFLYARKCYDYFAFGVRDFQIAPQLIKKILETGIPLALQSSTIAISGIVLQGFTNSFDSVVIAARAAAQKFDGLVNMPLASIGIALTTYTGQNISAKKIDRVYKGLKIFWIISIVFCIAVFGVGHIFGEDFMRIFVREESVIECGANAIRITATYIILLANLHLSRAIINGAGDVKISAMGGFVEVVGRLGFASLFILVLKIGVDGLWYTNAACWGLTGLFFFVRLLSGKWKNKVLLQ